MNRIFQIFLTILVLGVAGVGISYTMNIIDMGFLQDWAIKALIIWTILFVVAILVRSIMNNNSLKQVIEWNNQLGSSQIIFWKWDGNLRDEVKNKSKIVITPEQGAILVQSGKIVDILTEEGVYTLDSKNIPFITNLIKFMQDSESEHKVQIYFYKKTEIANLAWGTSQPIVYQDETYGFPLRFGMFGNYSVILQDTKKFFTDYLSGISSYSRLELEELLRSRMVSELARILPSLGYSYLDLDKNRDQLRHALLEQLRTTFGTLGIQILDVRIDGLSFDSETRKYIDTVATASAKKKAAEDVQVSYSEFEKLGALRDAAQNESNTASMIAGVNIGNSLGGIITPEQKVENK